MIILTADDCFDRGLKGFTQIYDFAFDNKKLHNLKHRWGEGALHATVPLGTIRVVATGFNPWVRGFNPLLQGFNPFVTRSKAFSIFT